MYDVQIKTTKNWVLNYQIKKVGKFPNPKEIEKLKHNESRDKKRVFLIFKKKCDIISKFIKTRYGKYERN